MPTQVLADLNDLAAKALNEYSAEEQNALWYLAHAQEVRSRGYTLEGFMSFAAGMLFEGAEKPFRQLAEHHLPWIRAILENQNIAILCPPESAKTTVVSILFTLFTVGHFPNTMSIIVSVSDGQAEDIASTVATFIDYHPFWKMCFPDIVKDKARGWGVDKGYFVKREGPYERWLQERGPRKDPTFFGAGYQNRAIIGKRVDGVFIVDDIMDESNTRSEPELQFAKAVFSKTISSRPTEEGKLVLVGTPWRDDDVYAEAAATGLYTTIITPAAKMDSRGGLYDSYWPSQWPIERLQRKRQEIGEMAFQLMYMMNLEARKGTVLQMASLEPRYPFERIQMEWPHVLGIDFAISSTDINTLGRKDRSRFALADLVIAPSCLVVVGGVVQHVTLQQAIEITKARIDVLKPRKTAVEVWGSGEAFFQQLEREMPGAVLMRVRDTHDKTMRFLQMERHFSAGRVRMSSEETHFITETVKEWGGYLDKTSPCDTLDSIANAIQAAGFAIYSGEILAQERDHPELAIPQIPRQLQMPSGRFAAGGRSGPHVPYPEEKREPRRLGVFKGP